MMTQMHVRVMMQGSLDDKSSLITIGLHFKDYEDIQKKNEKL